MLGYKTKGDNLSLAVAWCDKMFQSWSSGYIVCTRFASEPSHRCVHMYVVLDTAPDNGLESIQWVTGCMLCTHFLFCACRQQETMFSNSTARSESDKQHAGEEDVDDDSEDDATPLLQLAKKPRMSGQLGATRTPFQSQPSASDMTANARLVSCAINSPTCSNQQPVALFILDLY